ncbi:alpha/beta hydrolase [Hasllibacter sp. MH4015]|uniref:alpha/beta hydrolase n=1 Tax=Hasllibacter sp. MH4015 TaxID=2854029 RepID=UPI001CD4AEB3|nr:alpha/beta hydrolase [Hasllibacter sp. MH4015]
MNDLTAIDRFFVFQARTLERAVLRFVAPQRVLRVLFAISTRLGGKLPRGMIPIRDRHDGLWFRPDGVDRNAPVILYIHGGGFTIGSPRTHAPLVGALAKATGLRAYAPRYRLAPEHPFPAAREDVIAAYARLVEDGTPPVAIAGDSAGGCLALSVLQHARDAGLPLPKACCLIGPVADLSGDIEERFAGATNELLIPPEWPARIESVYLPGTDPTDPDVSPLHGDLTGLPPTLIHAAEGEALAQDSARIAEAMDDATLDLWPGLMHVWHLHAGLMPAADRAIAQLGDFIASHR